MARKDPNAFEGDSPSTAPAAAADTAGVVASLLQRVTELEGQNQELRDALAAATHFPGEGDCERALRELLDAAPHGSHMYQLQADGDLIFVGANRAADRILGVDHQQFLGMPIEEAFPALRDTEVPAAYRAVAATGGRFETELIDYEDVRVSGAFEVAACQVGRHRVVAFFRDVTERKQAEQERERLLGEVRHRAAALDAVIESIPDGILLYGPGCHILRMNSAAGEILGYGPEQQRLSLAERLVWLRAETPGGTPLTADNEPFRSVLREVPVQNFIMVLRPAGREPVWISFSAAPMLTPGGVTTGMVGAFVDVTALHKLEEQREDLLRAVSHDLGAPLVGIGGFAQLLRQKLEAGGADPAHLTYLRYIFTDVRRMRTMIRDLVDSVRLEAGQLAFQVGPVSLQHLVPECLARAAAAMDVERVEVALSAALPLVSADPNRLDRVLTNLVSNALKYSDPETPVCIEAACAGGAVTLSVKDQGVGVSAADLPHVFDRFYRVPGERKAEGLGLGLYITRLFVEAMQGRIWVESEPGKGSTFHVTLPAA